MLIFIYQYIIKGATFVHCTCNIDDLLANDAETNYVVSDLHENLTSNLLTLDRMDLFGDEDSETDSADIYEIYKQNNYQVFDSISDNILNAQEIYIENNSGTKDLQRHISTNGAEHNLSTILNESATNIAQCDEKKIVKLPTVSAKEKQQYDLVSFNLEKKTKQVGVQISKDTKSKIQNKKCSLNLKGTEKFVNSQNENLKSNIYSLSIVQAHKDINQSDAANDISCGTVANIQASLPSACSWLNENSGAHTCKPTNDQYYNAPNFDIDNWFIMEQNPSCYINYEQYTDGQNDFSDPKHIPTIDSCEYDPSLNRIQTTVYDKNPYEIEHHFSHKAKEYLLSRDISYNQPITNNSAQTYGIHAIINNNDQITNELVNNQAILDTGEIATGSAKITLQNDLHPEIKTINNTNFFTNSMSISNYETSTYMNNLGFSIETHDQTLKDKLEIPNAYNTRNFRNKRSHFDFQKKLGGILFNNLSNKPILAFEGQKQPKLPKYSDANDKILKNHHVIHLLPKNQNQCDTEKTIDYISMPINIKNNETTNSIILPTNLRIDDNNSEMIANNEPNNLQTSDCLSTNNIAKNDNENSRYINNLSLNADGSISQYIDKKSKHVEMLQNPKVTTMSPQTNRISLNYSSMQHVFADKHKQQVDIDKLNNMYENHKNTNNEFPQALLNISRRDFTNDRTLIHHVDILKEIKVYENQIFYKNRYDSVNFSAYFFSKIDGLIYNAQQFDINYISYYHKTTVTHETNVQDEVQPIEELINREFYDAIGKLSEIERLFHIKLKTFVHENYWRSDFTFNNLLYIICQESCKVSLDKFCNIDRSIIRSIIIGILQNSSIETFIYYGEICNVIRYLEEHHDLTMDIDDFGKYYAILNVLSVIVKYKWPHSDVKQLSFESFIDIFPNCLENIVINERHRQIFYKILLFIIRPFVTLNKYIQAWHKNIAQELNFKFLLFKKKSKYKVNNNYRISLYQCLEMILFQKENQKEVFVPKPNFKNTNVYLLKCILGLERESYFIAKLRTLPFQYAILGYTHNIYTTIVKKFNYTIEIPCLYKNYLIIFLNLTKASCFADTDFSESLILHKKIELEQLLFHQIKAKNYVCPSTKLIDLLTYKFLLFNIFKSSDVSFTLEL